MTRLPGCRRAAALAAVVLALGTTAPAAIAAPGEQEPSGRSSDRSAADTAPKRSMDGPGLTEAMQKRYNAVGLALVKAINAGDKSAYRALFTDEGWDSAMEWWRDMFAVQVKRFGRIEKAWAPTRGVIVVGRIGVSGQGDGAGMLVRFEEPAGGLLTFTLDDTDHIVATTVFIKEELGHAEPEGLSLLFDGE